MHEPGSLFFAELTFIPVLHNIDTGRCIRRFFEAKEEEKRKVQPLRKAWCSSYLDAGIQAHRAEIKK